MAQQKQPMIFDKNELTRALLGPKHYYWEQIFTRELTNSQRSFTYTDLRDFIDNEMKQGHTNDVILGKYQYELKTNPNGDFATEFRKYWDFMKYVFIEYIYNPEYINNYKLILNKINAFDKDVQVMILERLRDKLKDKVPADLMEVIYTKIVNNEYAYTDDKIYSAHGLLHKNHDVVRDVIELLKHDLEAELKLDFPDQQNIKKICNSATHLMDALQRSFDANDPHVNNIQNSLSKNYIKTVRDEFNIGNILAVGADYIKQYNETLENELARANHRADNAEREMRKYKSLYENNQTENDELKKSLNETEKKYQTEKQKNENLTKQLNSMQKQIVELEKFIKGLKLKIGALRAGLGGKGVKEVQEYMQKMPMQETR